MRVKPNLVEEYREMSETYRNSGVEGRDLMALVEEFGEVFDHLRDDSELYQYASSWALFLERRQHNMTVFPVPMAGLLIHILVTYWPQGQRLFEALPVLEKMMVRDLFADMSKEIGRRIGTAPDSVLPVPVPEQ